MPFRTSTASFLILWFVLSAVASAEEGQRKQVFNGKNLDGWTVSRCEAAVEDGVLVLKEGNGLVYLKGPYRDFVFEFQWKARNPEMWDSGVYFRCDAPPETEKRPWPKRYQVNLRKGMEGNVNALPNARSEGLAKPGKWNEMKLTCIGKTAKLEFNGKVAWEATGLEQEEGIIALQAETPGGGQFEFRKIFVTKLEGKKTLPR